MAVDKLDTLKNEEEVERVSDTIPDEVTNLVNNDWNILVGDLLLPKYVAVVESNLLDMNLPRVTLSFSSK